VRPRIADAADYATNLYATPKGLTADAVSSTLSLPSSTERITVQPLKSLAAIDPAKKAASLFEEFKNFAFKGNVIDLAVGVIIGAAFGGIVKSLVDDIFMPLIGLISQAMGASGGYESWQWNGVKFGAFLGQLVNFLLVAAILFVFIVKFLGWIMHFKKQEAVAPPPPTKEQELLMEIRDLLKQQASTAAQHPPAS
jgi:large conductance mechanosensitive channel